MRRVMVIGAVGTGKSTLGTALGRTLGLPVIHLDLIVWQPGAASSTTRSLRRSTAN